MGTGQVTQTLFSRLFAIGWLALACAAMGEIKGRHAYSIGFGGIGVLSPLLSPRFRQSNGCVANQKPR
jgi:hypothetical protein